MQRDDLLNKNIPNVLIVDDVHTNLKILGTILENEGYKVRPVTSGPLALKVVEKEKPDIILLDIMMPGMDGFEVCRQLKENQMFSDIPVIFISALNETKHIIKALNSGGVDYITKPFNADEVKARVSTHIQLYLQKKELEEQRIQLQKLNEEKDKFYTIIAHDLRSPFHGFLGLTEILDDELYAMNLAEIKKITSSLRISASNYYSLLENMLEWAKIVRGIIPFEPQLMALHPVILESLAIVQESARNKEIEIKITIPEEMEVFADNQILQTIIRNLVSNAVKFTYRGGEIALTAVAEDDNMVKIYIADHGIGMNKNLCDNLFRPGWNTGRKGTENETSTGFGLLICKELIEKHGGQLEVKSEIGSGSTFKITIPCKAKTGG